MSRRYPIDAPVSWVRMCRVIARANGAAVRRRVKRYPLQDLIDAAGLANAGMADRELARRLHMDPNVLARARSAGFTESAADRYACRSGLVPWLVWPQWIEDVIEDCSRECADENCDVRFVPKQRNKRFCSHQCAKNNWARRRYQADAEWKATLTARKAAYYEETSHAQRLKARQSYQRNRESVRARQAAYYQANRERLLAKQHERDARRRAEREAA